MEKIRSAISMVIVVAIAGDVLLGGHFIAKPALMLISGHGLSETFWGCSDWLWDGPEGNAVCRDDWT